MVCYQAYPSLFFISNQTRRCFQQLQSCVYKTIIYKHIPKSVQRIQFTHWNSRSGIPFVANIYSMLHVYGVVSYQTWHHLKTSENKFTTFDVNRPPYIRFASYLYEFMYQHISSLKSTPDPFNTSLWSSHSGYNSTIPSYSFCQECLLIFIVMVVNISDTYCQKTTTKHLSSMRNVCASNKSI